MKRDLSFSLVSKDLTFDDFEHFILDVSPDFNPAFLSYVDVKSYYKKIMDFAEILVCRDESKIVGLIVFYCNNLETKEGYTAFLAVKKEYRGLHIATDLMTKIFDIAKDKGMNTLKLRTNNPLALECYKKIGYEIYDEVFEEENNLVRYYMIKKL